MTDFILQIEPWIDSAELDELKRVVDSTFVVEHDLTKEFEQRICELTGSKYAIAITNGTAALYCCIKALGIGPGDEVIVPNITFIASANAVLMAGATPVLCEVDEKTFCIDLDEAEKCITEKTKAIMPVHLYGLSCDMDSLLFFCKKHNIQMIEDAAQGVGVLYKDRHVGTFGDLGVLSFYGNKTITCGEGGVIITDDEELRNECYRMKNHGRDQKGFLHPHIGFNFCFTEMQAAIGISQMKKLPVILEKKKNVYDLYQEHLSGLSDGFQSVHIPEYCTPVHWFTSFLTNEKKAFIRYMTDNKIQTREFFLPLNMQPCYELPNMIKTKTEVRITRRDNYEPSKHIFDRGISLPSSYSLTKKDQMYVINKIEDFISMRDLLCNGS